MTTIIDCAAHADQSADAVRPGAPREVPVDPSRGEAAAGSKKGRALVEADPADAAPIEGGKQDRPLLTVMIPVYNGGRFLSSLLTVFRTIFREHPELLSDIEIVVCNNVSTDNTLSVARSFLKQVPNLRIVNHALHKKTAEENIFRSFNECRGYYTWALGVDDIPNQNSFVRVMELLRRREHAFYVFNFSTISEKMKATHYSNFFITSYSHPTNLLQLTSKLGFWFTIAGISGQILRTDRVQNYDLDGLIKSTSPIYAHVTAYLECFSADSCLLVSESLVYYQITYRDVEHWRKGAEILQVFDEYFWTLGFIKQLKYLIRKRVVPPRYLGTLLDNNDHFFFRPICVIADKLVNQLKIMGGTTNARNRLTPAEFEELVGFIFDSDPLAREVVWCARDIFETLHRSKPVWPEQWGKLDMLYNEYASNFIFVTMLTCICGEFEIYDLHGRYWAVYRHAKDLVSEHLRQLSEPDLAPFIYIDGDLEALKARLPDGRVAEAAHKERIAETRAAGVASELRTIRDHLGQLGAGVERLHSEAVAQREVLALIGERMLTISRPAEAAPALIAPPVAPPIAPLALLPHGGAQGEFSGLLRQFRVLFDPVWYAQQAVLLGEESRPQAHDLLAEFESVGSRAGRSPNAWFDEPWYLLRYPDAEEMIRKGRLVSGLHHYMLYGFKLRHDPGPRFSEQRYLDANPDVALAIAEPGAGLRFGLEHFLMHGQAEGRSPVGGRRSILGRG